jgi:uncharacterized protein YutE (UPF0331/DUF86 family)
VVDSNIILSRITKIRECVANLKRYAVTDAATFLEDVDLSSSAERQLQVAIQSVIDVGNHVLADKDLGTAKDYKDIFRLLARQRIISKRLATALSSMAGLRNVLVHDYLEVDLKIVYRILKEDLGDFDKFIASILKLV